MKNEGEDPSMKKFLALLLAATMLCSITAAFAEAADTTLVVAT